MSNLNQKRYGSWALVTGATSGIGAELTRQLAAQGLNVLTCARTAATLEQQAVALRREFAVEVRPLPVVLSSRAGTEAVIAALGRKADAIPGLRNRVMAFMMTRLLSRGAVAWMFKLMMGRALKLGPGFAAPAR
jgi:NADP-dependent 3-hydroxy acid dehydrogenase YdfG